MLTYDEARNIIMQNVHVLDVERVELLDSLGRVLAEDAVAPWNMPPCSNSAMDGYAVRTSDCQPDMTLTVIDCTPAGAQSKKTLRPGTAIRIMTGAPIPSGCDSIVPWEEVTEYEGRVQIRKPIRQFQNVRLAGEDIREGETILTKHTKVRPVEINVMASLGRADVSVFRKPRVAIVATGDELLDIGASPSSGRVIDSNSYFLAAAVKYVGGTPVMLGIARDNADSLRQRMTDGLNADVLITSAGVSGGDRDLVRHVLNELGVEQLFAQVDVKPGKPLWFGIKNKTVVFALPGNPVATMLTFEEFVAPAILKMMGREQVFQPMVAATLRHEIRKPIGRTQLLRVKLEYSAGNYFAKTAGSQETSRVSPMLNANAIAVLPRDRAFFAEGDPVQVHLLPD